MKKPKKNKRNIRRFPKKENVSAVLIDRRNNTVMFVTKDMLTNQIYRDGPTIAGSFDELGRPHIIACSEVISRAQAVLIRHLPKIDDKGSEATCARLLYSAAQTYTAAIEVARRGYPREHGALCRMIVEAIATVLAIAIDGGGALEKFNKGKLESTKTIGIAKKALPFIGQMNGMLSNSFVHVGTLQNSIDGAKPYRKGDERFNFVITLSRLMALLIDIVTELIFAHEMKGHRYWRREGKGWLFEPNEEVRKWMETFAPETKATSIEPAVAIPDIQETGQEPEASMTGKDEEPDWI